MLAVRRGLALRCPAALLFDRKQQRTLAVAEAAHAEVLEEALHFGSEINDPVRLVFALAAKDHDGHIDALGMLGELLSDQGFVNFLLNSSRSEDIRLELELRTGTIE